MAKQSDFDKFLSGIEPSSSTVSYISSVQNNLRDYLKAHDSYADIYEESFLSGSYAKHTSIRPSRNDKKRDVDIIIVTKHNEWDDSSDVLQELYDVLIESDKYKNAKMQHHSIGIELSQISIDVVPVIQDEWDADLYYICNSETGEWSKTDPKGHKEWSTKVNQDNKNAYKPLVKILKWWRRKHCPSDLKYPKGITLEKIIADNLGDCKQSTEDLLIETIQNVVEAYKEDYADKNLVPFLADPSIKVLGNDLLSGYASKDFSGFIYKLEEHAKLLNDSGTENDIWREILGDEFPKAVTTASHRNELICELAQHKQKLQWPFARGGAAFISVKVISPLGAQIEYHNNGTPLEKGCSLHFKAITGVKPPYTVKWQITNTGDEARLAGCLRGNFENSDEGPMGKKEGTSYVGSHSVQCFIIKRNACVAKSKSFIVNIK